MLRWHGCRFLFDFLFVPSTSCQGLVDIAESSGVKKARGAGKPLEEKIAKILIDDFSGLTAAQIDDRIRLRCFIRHGDRLVFASASQAQEVLISTGAVVSHGACVRNACQVSEPCLVDRFGRPQT